MAKSILETEFRGDGTHFRRESRRVAQDGKKMGERVGSALDKIKSKATQAAGKLKLMAAAAAAALGAATKAGGSGIVDRLQEATRAGADFEKFQRLANVFDQFRLDADVAGDALTELRLALSEALVEGGDKAEAFAMLGLNIERMGEMAPVDRFLALAEAVSKSDDKARALVATSKVFGEDVAPRLNEVLNLGAEGIAERSAGSDIVSRNAAESLRKKGADLRAATRAAAVNTAGGLAGLLSPGRDVIRSGSLDASGLEGAFEPYKRAVREGVEEGMHGAAGMAGVSGLGLSPDDGTRLGRLNYGGREGTPLSATARKSETERDRFFKEARARMGRNAETVEEINNVLQAWKD